MHYNTTPRLHVSAKQVSEAFQSNPVSREIALSMLLDGVKIEFRRLHQGGNKGVAMLEESTDVWCITVDNQLGIDATEEVIWHELVHLHLRRIFNGFVTTQHDTDVHSLIIDLGKALAQNSPVSYQELMWYCRPHE